MIVSIHQSNFVPWLPYFQKMEMCDVFIILTHCQFEKNGYQNRFFYKDRWQTMSVSKGMTPITSKKYLKPQEDWKRIKFNIPSLSRFDSMISESLVETNVRIILMIKNLLGIKTEVIPDYETNLKGTDRLVHLCKEVGATTYIAGPSGGNYMEMDKFEKAGIKVRFQTDQIKKHVLDIL